MKYIFVWQKTGECRVARFGEWWLSDTPHWRGPFQCNGIRTMDKFEIVVRRPVDSRKGYKMGAVIGKDIAL